MTKWISIFLALVLGTAAVCAYLLRRPATPEWTTTSPEARRHLELGLEAFQKYYAAEAREHVAKALELDPGFLMAQVLVFNATPSHSPRYRELRTAIETTDLTRVTDREAFLARYHLARRDGDASQASSILDDYLADHPEDPYALDIACERLWMDSVWTNGEECYEKLLDLDPNWVTAQNRLGYLAMALGQFEKAEDRFRTYRYVAPDQANPHDSLGELLVLLGRFDEARAELEEAIAIRPDFCASYQNLVFMAMYSGETEAIDGFVEQSLAAGCEREMAARLQCHTESFELFRQGEWEQLANAWDDVCCQAKLTPFWLPHLGALMTADMERAREIERAASGEPAGALHESVKYDDSPLRLHLEGRRALAEGDAPGAVEKLSAADEQLDYWGLGAGMFKLYNRVVWVGALERAGRDQEAARLLAGVEKVNPPLVAAYRDGTLPMP